MRNIYSVTIPWLAYTSCCGSQEGLEVGNRGYDKEMILDKGNQSVSWAKRRRSQISTPSTGDSMCKGRAAFVELQVIWCGWSKACKQGSGDLSQEKEARTRLFWASFTVLHFPSKEQLSDTTKGHLKERPRILTCTVNNFESRLLRPARVRPRGWYNAADVIFARPLDGEQYFCSD